MPFCQGSRSQKGVPEAAKDVAAGLKAAGREMKKPASLTNERGRPRRNCGTAKPLRLDREVHESLSTGLELDRARFLDRTGLRQPAGSDFVGVVLPRNERGRDEM